MATEKLGTAVLTLSVDTTDASAQLARARQQVGQFGTDAEQAYIKADAKTKRAMTSLSQYVALQGKSADEQKIMRAQWSNVDPNFLKGALDRLKQLREEAAKADTQIKSIVRNPYGLTDKQQTAAMRQVPAQLTDIFVSLQGGQNPLTVLLQQGGQLKDVFGGAVPAVKALGAQLVGLLNPITLIAAGVVGVTAAFANAEGEQKAFAVALAESGNQADISVAKLSSMASVIGDIQGVTVGRAADTLAAVASTGRFTAEQILLVATAAEKMRVTTGQEIDKTVDAFTKLARDPVAGILELNETQNFLTQSVYDQIKALQLQGDTAAAQDLALKTYASRVDNVTETVSQNIGYLQQFAKEVKSLWAGVVDAVMGIGRATTNADLVKQQQSNIEGLIKARDRMRSGSIFQGGVYGGMSEKGYADAITRANAEIRRLTQFDNVKGGPQDTVVSRDQRELDAMLKAARTREQIRDDEIKQINKLAKTEEQRLTLIAAANRRYEASLPKGKSGAAAARGLERADARADLQGIKDAAAQELNIITNSTKLIDAQFQARLITQDAYYAKTRENTQASFAVQERSLLAQLDVLRARNVTGKDTIDVNREIAQLESQLARLRADNANATEILKIQEQDRNRKQREAIEDYNAALDRQVESIRRGYDAQVLSITLSDKEAEKSRALTEIYNRQTEALQRLQRQRQRGEITEAEYGERVRSEQRAADESARAVEDGYARMDAAQANWINSVRTGVTNWLDQQARGADQVEAITTSALDTAAEAFEQFATTGKVMWKDLLASMLKEIIKFLAKQAVMQFITSFAGSLAGGSTTTGGGAGNGYGPYNAKGNVYTNTPSLSAYSGTVVNQPTFFAKGGSVMGEAGPEGIFPLKRGRDGKLGIVANGNTGNVQLNMEMHIHNDGTSSTQMSGDAQAAAYKDFMRDVGGMVDAKLVGAVKPGGQLWKLGVGRAS